MAVVQYKNFSYLKGPAGEQGPKGDKGDRGLKGDHGPIGLTGAPGNVNYGEIRSLFSGIGLITYNNTNGVIGFNATGLATETYVNNIVNDLIGNSPQALNTLNELAAALNNDASFSTTVVTSLAGKLSLAGGTMTGQLVLNSDPGSNLEAATKQYVDNVTNSIVTSYNDLTDKPTIPADTSDLTNSAGFITNSALIGYSTFSGSYTDLTNQPTLFSGLYTDLINKPNLATIATSGSYTDLTGKPIIPVVPTVLSSFTNDVGYLTSIGIISYNDLSNKPSLFSGAYVDLTGKPTLFSGSYADLTNKPSIPTSINQLTDVDTMTTEPTDGQTLVWSSLTSKWIPGEVIGTGGGSSNATIITSYNFNATAGQTEFSGPDTDNQLLSYTLFDVIQVFKNGILLRNNIQYNINDSGWIDYEESNDIVSLIDPTNLDDWVNIVITNTSGTAELILEGGNFEDSGTIVDYGVY